MTTYSDSEKQRLLSFPIESVLAAYGKRTDHRGYMYYSPFRDEVTPSFHIDFSTNRWFDFGTSEGGGLVDLVCLLSGCQKGETLDILAALDANFVHIPVPEQDRQASRERTPSQAVNIVSAEEVVTSYRLLEYASQRKIPQDVLNKYCREVRYCIHGKPQSTYYAIGFPNNSGGYVLRSSKTKICSGSDITTLDCRGRLGGRPSSSRAIVFEGFFDMLSWGTLFGSRALSCDVCVLNGVSNWKRAVDWLAGHGRVELCLDNDEAGRRTVSDLRDSVKMKNGNLEMWDMSPTYARYKDVGEMLEASQAVRRSRSVR